MRVWKGRKKERGWRDGGGEGRGWEGGCRVGPQAKACPRTIFLAPALHVDDVNF